MKRLHLTIRAISPLLLLLIHTALPPLLLMIPPVEASAPSLRRISYWPDPIHDVSYSWENHSFVFRYRAHYMRVQPFVIYGGEYYGLQQILNYLKNHYPQIQFKEILRRVEAILHYGFNLTQIPSQVAQNLDYLGFRLMDLSFPLSWIELRPKLILVGQEPHEIQVIRIPRANLTLSFEDLLPLGYTIQAVNRTYVLIGEVRGRTDLYIDPLVYSGSYIEDSTPSTEEAPENMEALYQADLGGNLSLFSPEAYHETVLEDTGAQSTETIAANNNTADDMNLVPLDSSNDYYYWGHDDQFLGVELNVTTAGVYSATLGWQYYKDWLGGNWFTLSVTDNTNGFQNSGVNNITWSLPSQWIKTTINGLVGWNDLEKCFVCTRCGREFRVDLLGRM